MPVEYSVETIDKIVAKKLKSKTDKKVVNLQKALEGYCDYLKKNRKVTQCDPDLLAMKPILKKNTCRFCQGTCGAGFDANGGAL
jgi:acetone carboxylase gamma subunit